MSEDTNREEMQTERLTVALEHVWERPIPFFRRRMVDAGLEPAMVRSLAELRLLPVTTKDDLRASEAEHPPFGDYRGAELRECIRMVTSTGTTGRPTVTLFTDRDLESDTCLTHRAFNAFGMRRGDVLLNSSPGYLRGVSQLLDYQTSAYGMLPVSLGPVPLDNDVEITEQLEVFRSLGRTNYLGYAPGILRFRDIAARRDAEFPGDFGIENLMIQEYAAQWVDARRVLERTLGTKLWLSVGLTEIYGMYARLCPTDDGVHVNDDHVIIECLDPATLQPVPAGEPGLLVATSLNKDNVILRYDTGDLGYLIADRCTCGDPSVRVVRLGRATDTVTVGADTILPSQVIRAIATAPDLPVELLLQLQIRRIPAQETLNIVLPPPRGDQDRKRAGDWAALAAERLGVATRIEFAVQGPSFAYKPSRIIEG